MSCEIFYHSLTQFLIICPPLFLISLGGPDANCNPEEATDLTIFPEFVRYHSVPRDQIAAVLRYHTEIIGPRHQAQAYHKSDPEKYPLPADPVLSDEHQAQLNELKSKDEAPLVCSKYMREFDRIEHGAGTKFPLPMDIVQDTMILLCGHTIRDKRCGVTAPILKEQINMVMEKKHPNDIDNLDIELVSHVCYFRHIPLVSHQFEPRT